MNPAPSATRCRAARSGDRPRGTPSAASASTGGASTQAAAVKPVGTTSATAPIASSASTALLTTLARPARTNTAADPPARSSPAFCFIAKAAPDSTPTQAALGQPPRPSGSRRSSTTARLPSVAYHAGYGTKNGAPCRGASGRKKLTWSATATTASPRPVVRRVSA